MAICDVNWPVDFWLFKMTAYRSHLFRDTKNMPVTAGLTTEIFCPRMILKQRPGNRDIRNSGETIEHDDRGLPVFCSLLLKMPALISWTLSFLFLPGVSGKASTLLGYSVVSPGN